MRYKLMQLLHIHAYWCYSKTWHMMDNIVLKCKRRVLMLVRRGLHCSQFSHLILKVHSPSISEFHACVSFPLPPVRAPVPRAEQWEAGEPRGERQAEDDQRRAFSSAGEHEPGAGARPGAAGPAAGAGGPAATGERDVGIRTFCTYSSTV